MLRKALQQDFLSCKSSSASEGATGLVYSSPLSEDCLLLNCKMPTDDGKEMRSGLVSDYTPNITIKTHFFTQF